MKFEEEVISFIEKCPAEREHEYSMDIKYLALDLITEIFNYKSIAKKAIAQRVNHRLGFLCEITAKAAEELNEYAASKRLYTLSDELYSSPREWRYLDPSLAEFGKRILDSSPQTELNMKWHVKSTLNYKDIIEWAKIHSFGKNVTSPERKTA